MEAALSWGKGGRGHTTNVNEVDEQHAVAHPRLKLTCSYQPQVLLEVDEDREAFFGPNGIVGPSGGKALRIAPARQKAELSVESLKALISRVKGIIRWFKTAKNG